MRRLGSGYSAGSAARGCGATGRSRKRGRRGLGLAILVVGLMASMSGSASAGYLNPVGFSATGSEAGQIGMPGRAAVEQSTGNLFAVDTENDRVVVFKPIANGETEFLTEFGAAQLSEPWGIAIGEEAGNTYVYVADAGNNRIVKYDSDGAATPSFSVDAGFTSPALGTGTGQIGGFKASLAVDPTSGDLLVADPVRNRVVRLEDDGTPVAGGEFNGAAGAGSPGAFTGLTDIAVNSSGDVYVIDQTGDVIFQEGTAQALRYSAAGSYKATLTPVGPHQRPGTVAVRPDTDEVLVSGEQDGGYRYESPPIYLFDAENEPRQNFTVEAAWSKSIFGLAVSSAPDSRLYVLSAGLAPRGGAVSPGGAYVAYTGAPAPTVTLEPPTVLNGTDVELEGTVDPEGFEETIYRFELRPTGSSGEWLVVSSGSLEGDSPVAVSAEATELDAGTEYTARLIATSKAGEGFAKGTFATASGPPVARTLGGSARTTSSVRLNGLVRANGIPTQYYVEWGTTAAYGNRIPATGTLSAGSSGKPLVFSQLLEGLSAGQVIHYRYVAESAEGTSTGDDRTVETLPQPLGFEMVSPPDKNGNGISSSIGSVLNESGNVALFSATGAFAGSEGNLPGDYYRAARGSDNWHTEGLQSPDKVETGLWLYTQKKSSQDLTKTVQSSHLPLTPDSVPGDSNLYLRDNLTGQRKLIAGYPDRNAFSGQSVVMGGTPDFSRVLISSAYPLTEGGPEGDWAHEALYMYDAAEEKLELVTKLPDGTPVLGEIPFAFRMGERAVSRDGHRVFWQHEGALYMWEDGVTTLISHSHRAGDDPTTPRSGEFGGASIDGNYVFFSSPFPLTQDSSEGELVNNLYRYDVETGELKNLTPGTSESAFGVNGIKWVAVNEDGSRAYFLAPQSRLLTPDAVDGKSNVYLWEEGATPADPGEWTQVAAVGYDSRTITARFNTTVTSPDGTYLAFLSSDPGLSAHSVISPNCRAQFDPVGYCNQVYLYDAETDQLSCVSCAPVGPPAGESLLGGRMRVDEAGMLSRVVLEDGSVFFETPNQLVPEDINNRIDVYRWRHGQIDLISTGKSSEPSYFGDATPDGSVVSFFTSEQLVKQDYDDLRDVYEVRVNGGLAGQNAVAPEPAPCVGEACRSGDGQKPGELSPATPSFSGGGNVKEPPKKRCPKGKHLKKVKGKQRCVKTKQGKHKKRAHAKRREASK